MSIYKNTTTSQALKMWIKITLIISFLFFPGKSKSHAATETELNQHSAEINSAIKTEDWNALKSILSEIMGEESKTDYPPIRFLYGHASLATGENNEAVKHFYARENCTELSNSLAVWHTWAGELARNHPEWSSAHFLLGDALVRMGNYQSGLKHLNRAVEINSKNLLALNARGVVHWLLHESDPNETRHQVNSANDFITTRRISPQFADTSANLGVIGLRNGSSLERAKKHFKKALALDPLFGLARNGWATALGASGNFHAFKREIKFLTKHAPETPFISQNASGDSKIPASIRGMFTEGKLKVDFLKGMFGGFEIGVKRNDRGGVYMLLREDKNLIIGRNNEPRVVATWFSLNYPAPTQPSVDDSRKVGQPD